MPFGAHTGLYCFPFRYKFPLTETEKYIDRMTEADDRFELYMELSLYRKAADCAIRMKDAVRLQEVKSFWCFNTIVIYRTTRHYYHTVSLFANSMMTNFFIAYRLALAATVSDLQAGRMCRDPKLLAQIQEALSKLT